MAFTACNIHGDESSYLHWFLRRFWGGMTFQGVLPFYYNRVTRPGRSQVIDRCVYNTMADTEECRFVGHLNRVAVTNNFHSLSLDIIAWKPSKVPTSPCVRSRGAVTKTSTPSRIARRARMMRTSGSRTHSVSSCTGSSTLFR